MSNFIVSAEHAVKVLNEAFLLDPQGISTLINSPVRTNDALANHPTIQAGSKTMSGKMVMDPNIGMCQLPGYETVFTIGFIGLLNGIFGVDENGQGPIARLVNDETGELEGFCVNTNLAPDARPVSEHVWAITREQLFCKNCNEPLKGVEQGGPKWIMPLLIYASPFCSPLCEQAFKFKGKHSD